MKSRGVLVVAPGRRVQGGITSVVRTHASLPSWEHWRCRWIETLGVGGKLRKAVSAASALIAFARELPSARIVHIHVAWKNGALRKLPFFLCAKASGRATIVHLHAPDMDEAMEGFRGAVLAYMLRRADRLVVLSEYWRKAVVNGLAVDGDRVTILPNPVVIRPGTRTPARATVLFVGKIEERKGVTALVSAFRQVRARHPDAELRLAGDNVQFLSRFSGAELEGVRPLGWLTSSELERELRHATCLCLPSRGEGVPMAVLEAMAGGCPVVTTRAGGLVDVVEDGVTGFVVAVDDVSALARRLVGVIEDPGAGERVARGAARAVRERHGLDRVDRLLAELYSDAVGVPEGGAQERGRPRREESMRP